MSTFIKKILLFIFISAVSISSIFFFTLEIVKENANFKIDNKNSTLIVGHSHAECAFNDTIVDNLTNLSASGESYFWTYPKIKQTISQNPNINTVFIEFSNNQIEKDRDEWIWGDVNLSARLFTYIPFLDFEDIKLLLAHNRSGFIQSTSKSFRRNFTKIFTNDYDFRGKVGGYLWLERNHTDSLIANLDTLNLRKVPTKISMKNIEYLEKTILFCEQNNIKVYLVRAPQHKFFIDRKNEKTFVKVRETYFNDIEFLDFNNFSLKNDEFGDFGHLNHKGAKIFSTYFNSLIHDGLLEQKDKKSFIANSMKKSTTTQQRL